MSFEMDGNYNMRTDFMLAARFIEAKKQLKKTFEWRCKMEKENLEKKEKSLYDSVCSPFLVAQADLKEDCHQSENIVFMTLDVSPFGIGFLIQTVVAGGKTYRRLISYNEKSKFQEVKNPNA